MRKRVKTPLFGHYGENNGYRTGRILSIQSEVKNFGKNNNTPGAGSKRVVDFDIFLRLTDEKL